MCNPVPLIKPDIRYNVNLMTHDNLKMHMYCYAYIILYPVFDLKSFALEKIISIYIQTTAMFSFGSDMSDR